MFADVDARTLSAPAAVEAAITPRTKAIVAVDIDGYPCEVHPLRELADRHGLALIQDSCEALGARYKGKLLGAQGLPSVFVFYPNKQITTGEGGIVTTDPRRRWRLLRSLRNQGRGDDGGWLEHVRLGYNYRLDDIGAAMGSRRWREARRDPVLRAVSQRPTRSCSAETSTASSCRAPTTRITSGRGSSTS